MATVAPVRPRPDDAFLAAHPGYRRTMALDRLRAAEYARLDDQGEIYLDYAGGSLYAASQVEEHLSLLRRAVFGNPHSVNPTSAASTALAEQARGEVLRFFGADEVEYTCIFTANASGALRLVGEAYPFGPGGCFLATADNHNSVNGIREFARAQGARTAYVAPRAPDLRVDDAALERHLEDRARGGGHLFAYPAQSNFSGVKHPLDWIVAAHERGWDVLLDAAAFVPTSPLDLAAHKPDFVAISFYKLFGYPTGIGALLARHSTLRRLRRPWFSGGTVMVATVGGERSVPLPGHGRFEDGTIDYLGLPAIGIGLRHIERIGIDAIGRRVEALGAWLLAGLRDLRHSDGSPATRIYGPPTWQRRGPTIAFNFLHRDGRVVDERYVDRAAAAHGISLRTGCFCNPGAGEAAFALSAAALRDADLDDAAGIDAYLARVGMATGGAVRVSLGLVTNLADISRFLAFASGFRDLTTIRERLPPRASC
ncbi:MAG: aminotransferase class V-fold PLP-dependent enzyme [Solirubrobacteraceae bacterium]